MAKIEQTFGPFTFTSDFDSGNLSRVESRSTFDKDQDHFEFDVWTAPDGAATEFENANRTWFYFAVVVQNMSGKTLHINVRNLNRQTRLYQQGMAPFVRSVPGRGKWERVKERPTFEMCDGSMVLSFEYTFTDNRRSTTYFSFCYPFSYSECQKKLDQLEQHFASLDVDPSAARSNDIYFQRELVTYSLDKRRLDCLTVTSFQGITTQREDRLEGLFPEKDYCRPFVFRDKKVFFLSSRVHPGETPSSFIFNGFLNFILRPDDPRAAALRDRYVFKLIPMLNPDGVFRGHYRTDQRGVNLNRVYLDPDQHLHPTIFATQRLLLYYHSGWRIPSAVEMRDDRDCVELSDVHTHNGQTEQQENDMNILKKHELLSLTQMDVDASECASIVDGSDCNDDEYAKHAQSMPGLHHSLCVQRNRSDTNGHSVITTATTLTHSMSSSQSISTKTEKNGCCFSTGHTSGCQASNITDSLKCQQDSSLAFYVDLHGHANKQGCFMYGNHFANIAEQTENILLPKLVSLNSAHFDFAACNFSLKNMYTKDKGHCSSKEGSGRVGIHKATGIIHCYTLEGNYNSGRQVNSLSPATMDDGRATPPPLAGFPPRFTTAMYEEVGRGLAVAALDIIDCNPWSRVSSSEYKSLAGVREWVRGYIKSCRARSEGLKKPRLTLVDRAKATGSSSPEPVSPVSPQFEVYSKPTKAKPTPHFITQKSRQLIVPSVQLGPHIQQLFLPKQTTLLDRRMHTTPMRTISFSDGEVEKQEEQETRTRHLVTKRKGSLPSTFTQQPPHSRMIKNEKSCSVALTLSTRSIPNPLCKASVLTAKPSVMSVVMPSSKCKNREQWVVSASQKVAKKQPISDWTVTSVSVPRSRNNAGEQMTIVQPRRFVLKTNKP